LRIEVPTDEAQELDLMSLQQQARKWRMAEGKDGMPGTEWLVSKFI